MIPNKHAWICFYLVLWNVLCEIRWVTLYFNVAQLIAIGPKLLSVHRKLKPLVNAHNKNNIQYYHCHWNAGPAEATV